MTDATINLKPCPFCGDEHPIVLSSISSGCVRGVSCKCGLWTPLFCNNGVRKIAGLKPLRTNREMTAFIAGVWNKRAKDGAK